MQQIYECFTYKKSYQKHLPADKKSELFSQQIRISHGLLISKVFLVYYFFLLERNDLPPKPRLCGKLLGDGIQQKKN